MVSDHLAPHPERPAETGRTWRTKRALDRLLAPPGLLGSLGALVGAGLLVWSAVVHLHLWSLSYHVIPTIGPLFLAQGIGGLVVAVAVALLRRALVMLAGALFSLGTIAGLLVSVNYGLFGFQDSLSAPFATSSLVVEAVAAGVLLASAALVLVRRPRPGRRARRVRSAKGPQPGTEVAGT